MSTKLRIHVKNSIGKFVNLLSLQVEEGDCLLRYLSRLGGQVKHVHKIKIKLDYGKKLKVVEMQVNHGFKLEQFMTSTRPLQRDEMKRMLIGLVENEYIQDLLNVLYEVKGHLIESYTFNQGQTVDVTDKDVNETMSPTQRLAMLLNF